MTTNGAGFDVSVENPGSVIILQKRFGVGLDVVTYSAWGRWFGSMRCFTFELPDGRSCDMGPPSSAKMCKSFYSECYRSFIYEIFTASIAYHAIVLLHTVCGPCSEACVLPAVAVACQSYPCQVGRTIADSSMPVPGRLRCIGSVMLEISSSKSAGT
ncbi:hypothetical protein BHE74_00036289 [Ensete ventricosum]|nr:hypothetical protein BHE74_00036289 [Ensete ventricosum]